MCALPRMLLPIGAFPAADEIPRHPRSELAARCDLSTQPAGAAG